MRTMIYPKKKKKKPRASVPLKRSVHIKGKRWGWEYVEDFDHGMGVNNSKIKILSPDNEFYMKKIRDTKFFGERGYIIIPSTVKQFIIDELLEA